MATGLAAPQIRRDLLDLNKNLAHRHRTLVTLKATVVVCLTVLTVLLQSRAADYSGRFAPAATAQSPQKARRRFKPSAAHAHKTATLAALDSNFLAFLDAEDKSTLEKRLRVGIGRSLPSALEIDGSAISVSAWTKEPDGTFSYSVAVQCSGSQGQRIHLENVTLPAGASILVHDQGDTNEAAALKLEEATDVWSPSIFSETAIIECRLANLAEASALRLQVREVSHFYRSLKSGGTGNYSCIPQIACYPQWLSAARGVAMIQYVSGGSTYLCTGCLISTTDSSFTNNYFLTAHHCIGSQTNASTMQAFWLYQATNCGGAAPNLGSVPTSPNGGTLLATGAASDYTLLRLADTPPAGSTYLGWTTLPPTAADILTCIQHPGGGDKRISFGQYVDNSNPNLYGIAWNTGVTLSGSSGSPLLLADGSIIGQLFGGNSSCSWLYGEDLFGRFGLTYQQIKQWIDPLSQTAPAAPVLRSAPMTGGAFKLTVTAAPSTRFFVQASQDLVNWATLGSATTDSTGKATFQDTNSSSNLQQFYRAVWAAQAPAKTR